MSPTSSRAGYPASRPASAPPSTAIFEPLTPGCRGVSVPDLRWCGGGSLTTTARPALDSLFVRSCFRHAIPSRSSSPASPVLQGVDLEGPICAATTRFASPSPQPEVSAVCSVPLATSRRQVEGLGPRADGFPLGHPREQIGPRAAPTSWTPSLHEELGPEVRIPAAVTGATFTTTSRDLAADQASRGDPVHVPCGRYFDSRADQHPPVRFFCCGPVCPPR